MNGIEKHAAFYRGYLPDDRSLVPLTVLLSATLALWLLVYLVAAVAEAHQNAGAARVASVTFIRDHGDARFAERSGQRPLPMAVTGALSTDGAASSSPRFRRP